MQNIVYKGPGLGTLLFVLFLTLKLTGIITWSWWFITMPLWLPVVFVVTLFVIGVGVVTFLNR